MTGIKKSPSQTRAFKDIQRGQLTRSTLQLRL